LPPVVNQPVPKRPQPKPISQKKPVPKAVTQTQPKPVFKKRNIPQVSKPQPQARPVTQKPVAKQQKKKNPFETIFSEVLKELEVKEPAPRKPKPKPKLFKEKPKTTISKKIEQQQAAKPVIVKKKKKRNIRKKLKTFEFDAVDAVIYSEIFNRKY